jgi:ABC-type Fe3+-hydroxamate transport system substrate-binding protein
MGRVIRLERSAARIVSLSPSITELVFEAGAGSKLVGVSGHSDYPDSARSIPKWDASNPDLDDSSLEARLGDRLAKRRFRRRELKKLALLSLLLKQRA